MVFSEEDKTLISEFVHDYTLWTSETYETVPWQMIKRSDWTTLSRSCLKRECPHGSTVALYLGLCVSGLINERRDRLKAFVLVNGGHFERSVRCYHANCDTSRTDLERLKIFVRAKFQFCARKWFDRFHWLTIHCVPKKGSHQTLGSNFVKS